MATGSVPAMMDTSASPATPTRRPAENPTGGSPPAKRPAALASAQGLAGAAEAGLMDQTQISMAIRDLQLKFTNIETWATTVNDSITDHAGHIDHQKVRIESFAMHGRTVTGKISEISADVKEFARQTVENDSTSKAAIASVVELLGNEVEKLKQFTRDAGLALEARVCALEARPGIQTADGKVLEIENTMVRRTELLREQGVAVNARLDKLEHENATAQQQQQQQQQPPPSAQQRPADPMAGGNDAWSYTRSQTQHTPQAQHFDIGGGGGGVNGYGGGGGGSAGGLYGGAGDTNMGGR
jgi:uncharacterized tellurite resistance protein B-like protein